METLAKIRELAEYERRAGEPDMAGETGNANDIKREIASAKRELISAMYDMMYFYIGGVTGIMMDMEYEDEVAVEQLVCRAVGDAECGRKLVSGRDDSEVLALLIILRDFWGQLSDMDLGPFPKFDGKMHDGWIAEDEHVGYCHDLLAMSGQLESLEAVLAGVPVEDVFA